jgi:D-aminoacyl-tRNA deacylase
MKIITQRVKEASVIVENNTVGKIGKGVLVFLGIHHNDTQKQARWLVEKVINLRQFIDDEGKMNLSLKDVDGELLIISQFTLYGECEKGRRPSFTESAPPEVAIPLYEQFILLARQSIPKVETGIFGAKMEISLINDGPVTFIIEK